MSDNTVPTTAIDRAAPYARFGLSIFPVHVDDKSPMPGYGWVALASSKMNEVVEDFDRAAQLWGDDHVSVAWALGLDGYVAIDLDVDHKDWPQWAVDISGAAALNITRRGTHLIFQNPKAFTPGNTDTKFPTTGWGEVRGHHGYIVIAGADRPGLSLSEFDHCQSFPYPEWLEPYGGGADAVSTEEVVAFATAHNSASMPNMINGVQAACDGWDPKLAGDPAKGRHPFCVWMMTCVAEEALAGYYPFADGLRIVRAWWNRVTPPERHKREWNGIVTWAVGRALAKQSSPTESADEGESPVLDDDVTPQLLVGLVDWTTLLAEAPPPVEWLIEGVWERHARNLIVAGAGTGKSEWALWQAITVATGVNLVTGERQAEPVPLLYLDYEMNRRQLRTRIGRFGIEAGRIDLSPLGYRQHIDIQPLNTKAGVVHLLAALDAGGYQALMIDTMTGGVPGDENEALTYETFNGALMAGLNERGISVTILDHYGKDAERGARGSIEKLRQFDVAWGMSRYAYGGPQGTRLDCWKGFQAGQKDRTGNASHTVAWSRETDEEGIVSYHRTAEMADLLGAAMAVKVSECLALLEEAGIDHRLGRDKTRAALLALNPDYRCENTVLAAAIRERKTRVIHSTYPHPTERD